MELYIRGFHVLFLPGSVVLTKPVFANNVQFDTYRHGSCFSVVGHLPPLRVFDLADGTDDLRQSLLNFVQELEVVRR